MTVYVGFYVAIGMLWTIMNYRSPYGQRSLEMGQRMGWPLKHQAIFFAGFLIGTILWPLSFSLWLLVSFWSEWKSWRRP